MQLHCPIEAALGRDVHAATQKVAYYTKYMDSAGSPGAIAMRLLGVVCGCAAVVLVLLRRNLLVKT